MAIHCNVTIKVYWGHCNKVVSHDCIDDMWQYTVMEQAMFIDSILISSCDCVDDMLSGELT